MLMNDSFVATKIGENATKIVNFYQLFQGKSTKHAILFLQRRNKDHVTL